MNGAVIRRSIVLLIRRVIRPLSARCTVVMFLYVNRKYIDKRYRNNFIHRTYYRVHIVREKKSFTYFVRYFFTLLTIHKSLDAKANHRIRSYSDVNVK